MRQTRRGLAALAGAALVSIALAACGSSSTDDKSSSLIVGTTDRVVSIDPAGSHDDGSRTIQTQVYQYLLNFPAGSTELTPDAADKCDFTQASEYTCTIKPGLKFANGHDLTASDVAFSFKRIVKINDPRGPASLLDAMKSVEAKDAQTVVFTLNSPNDQTFPQILATSAGPIVDEQAYPADKVLDDDDAVKAQGFSGPYTITKYTKNQIAQFTANASYDGAYNKPKTQTITLRHFADANSMKLAIQNSDIDVAWRSLTPTDIESLDKTKNLKVHKAIGGELRYIVFNLKTMPGDDPAQKLAIRQAMASSLDREAISAKVYKGTYTPAYSAVPQGQTGAVESFKDKYGDKPNKAEAAKFLSDAGVTAPVSIDLQYNTDHYGSSSEQEYAAVKRQLEATGLFQVNLQSTEYAAYSKERIKDAYPIFQLGWLPDFPDADDYVTPFFAENNVLHSHYNFTAKDNPVPDMTKLLDSERTDANTDSRVATLKSIQDLVADQVPILPLLTGSQVAVGRSDVDGLDKTLDATLKFRFTSLSKS